MRRNHSSRCSNAMRFKLSLSCARQQVKDCIKMSNKSIFSSSTDTHLIISERINETTLPGYSCILFPLYQWGKKAEVRSVASLPKHQSLESNPDPVQRLKSVRKWSLKFLWLCCDTIHLSAQLSKSNRCCVN